LEKIRLYLVPEPNKPQRVIEVATDMLIMDRGEFKTPQTAQYVALRSIPPEEVATCNSVGDIEEHINALICWREPVDDTGADDPSIIEVPNPLGSGDTCLCGITCLGPKIQNIRVKSVWVPI
jgi:hypothetical protein